MRSLKARVLKAELLLESWPEPGLDAPVFARLLGGIASLTPGGA